MSREDVTLSSDHPAAVFLRPLADLPSVLAIPPLPRGKRGLFDVSLRTPGSKSLTNRALLLAALAEGESTLRSPLLEADDARRMRAALEQLGVGLSLERDGEDEILRVRGVGGAWKPSGEVTVNLNNAGTATRFLAAAALLGSAPIVIDGNARMRERPIGELAEVLTQLGAKVEYVGRDGYPPLRIHPLAERKGPGRVLDIPTTQSSQFISAILMVAPWLAGGLTIRLTGEITSPTYIEMTIGLLQQVGAMVKTSEDLRVIRVGPPSAQTAGSKVGLQAFDYDVEPDASGATYFWAAAAINPGSMARVTGLSHRSLQGDADFPSLLARMGAVIEQHPATPTTPHGVGQGVGFAAAPQSEASDARTHFIRVGGPGRLEPIMADLSKMPDTAMTLASVACFAPGMSILRGLRTLRVKETDRIEAMRNELTKIGVKIDCPVMGDHDVMGITPPPGDMALASSRVEFDTYDDHRMAMSLALIGLRRPQVFIKDPQCVAKTYPTFWRDLARLYVNA
jgi:3-phosphoshikimate 1-carboxyvinyltransferase